MIKKTIFLVLLLVYGKLQAADSLRVSFSKTIVKPGDTLDFDCLVPSFSDGNGGSGNATLNLWIEDLDKKRRWKFRWPVTDHKVLGSLAITENIPDGRYAFNFLVQRGFFRVSGKVKDHDKKETAINSLLIHKNGKESFPDIAYLHEDGSFQLKNTLFQDSAYYIFSPAKKVKNNRLSIEIETPLDSSFTPVFSQTLFITVGEEKNTRGKNNDPANYRFTVAAPPDAGALPGVTVTGRYKTKVEQFNDMYASGLFRSHDAIIFDGLDNNDIANAPTLLQYLQARIAGFSIKRNADNEELAYWRNEPVELFIDEFRVGNSDYNIIPATDVAMIKAFRPPAMLSPLNGSGGAIVIYTKKRNFGGDANNKHNFVVQGYSPIEAVWR